MKRSTKIGLGVAAGVVGVGVGAGVWLGRHRSQLEPEVLPSTPARDRCGSLDVRGEAHGVVYRSYTPAEPGPYPIVLMHGRGGTHDGMFDALAVIVLPAVQIYPQAPTAFGPKSFAWTRARSTDADWPEKQADAVWSMRPFIEWVSRCFGPPVVAGHSQGAHMAFGIAAAYPELVRAAVGVSGALTPALWGELKVPVVAVHGVEDSIVPIANARRMRDELGVTLVEVPGHGHAFSGVLKEQFESAVDLAGSAHMKARSSWTMWTDEDIEQALASAQWSE
ncbi:MAG: alpha/beta hydrolase [Nannocystales bacterium]